MTRPTRSATWNLVRDDAAVASAYAVCRPDRRWFVSVDAWDDQDLTPLVAAMVDDLRHDLYTRVDGADPATLELWSGHGFEPHRTDVEYLFSPDPDRTGLGPARLPPGIALASAADVDETELRHLDDTLRVDHAGSRGWLNDPSEFHDRIFDERLFDPRTHLVSLDDQRRQFAGLVRLRMRGTHARLDLLGVARPYRRTGLASAMLAQALEPVHERGITDVLAEADSADVAGRALLRSIGARQTGSSIELRRSASVEVE